MKVQNKEGVKPYYKDGTFFKPPWKPRKDGIHRPGKTMKDRLMKTGK